MKKIKDFKTFENSEEFETNEPNDLTIEEVEAKIKGDEELNLFDEVVEDIKELKSKLGKDDPEYRDLVALWHEHYHPEIMKRYEAGTAPE